MKIEKYFTFIDRTIVTINGVGHVFQTIKYQVFCVVRLRVLFEITFYHIAQVSRHFKRLSEEFNDFLTSFAAVSCSVRYFVPKTV